MGRPKINIGNCLFCDRQSWTKGLCSAHYKKQYYSNNREKENKSRSEFNKTNKHKMSERKRKRETKDINYKLANRLRHRIYSAIKTGGAINNLGCSIEELKKHLESQFKPGMSWGNYGKNGWHIDHIIPLASLDLTISENLKLVCHFTNLRPLWWHENLGRRYGKETR